MASLRTIYNNIRNRIVRPSTPSTPSRTINSPYGTGSASSNAGALQSASNPSVRTSNVSVTNASTGQSVSTSSSAYRTISSTPTGSSGGGSSRSSSSSSSSAPVSISKVSSASQLDAVSSGSQTQAQVSGLTPSNYSAVQQNQLKQNVVTSSISPNTYGTNDGMYRQSWKESFKQSFSTGVSNVKMLPNIIWGDGKWSDIQNPYKSFTYSTAPEGDRVVRNPTFTGGMDTGTISSTPLFEQQKFVTKGELYDRGLISESAVMGRMGDRNLKIAENVAPFVVIGAVSSVVAPVGAVTGAYLFTRYTPEAFNPNLPKSQRISSGITGTLGLAGFGAGVYGSFAQLEAQQVNIARDYLVTKNQNALGTRQVNFNSAFDRYALNTKAGTSSLNIQGRNVYQLTGTNTYRGFGEATQTINVRGFWTGNLYTSQSKLLTSTTGNILGSSSGGWTTSTGTLKTLTTSQVNAVSGSKDLFQNAFLRTSYSNPNIATRTIFAGRTNQGIPNYVFSQSGRINQVKFFTGDTTTRIDVNSALNNRALLKIKTSDFGGFSSGLGGSTRVFGSGTQSLGKLSSIPSNVARVGVSTTSGSSSILGATSGLAGLSSVSASMFKPSSISRGGLGTISSPSSSLVSVTSTGTLQIPSTYTSSTTSLRSLTSTSTTPAITTITQTTTGLIPAFTGFGSSTGRFPIQTGSFTFPIIDFPKFKPSFDFGMGSRKTGAIARRKYTPSFAGLILGKKGKSKKTTTGFEIRGIPKGFKWEFGRGSL